ncbi:MAG: hypothetical protein R3B70_46695 [Polyangiaceae bacterium]
MNITKTAFAGCLSLIAAATVAGNASAADGYLPGAACQPVDNTTVFIYHEQGEVYNNSSGYDRRLTCPLPHGATGQDDFQVQVSVWDGNPSLAVECTAQARNFGGPTLVGWSSDASVGTGRQTLTMTVYTTDPSAYHHVLCTVPRIGSSGASYLTALYYNEL